MKYYICLDCMAWSANENRNQATFFFLLFQDGVDGDGVQEADEISESQMDRAALDILRELENSQVCELVFFSPKCTGMSMGM